MRRFGFIVAAVVLAAAAYYFVAAPRVALAAIERAARADDVIALAYHVDFVSVREGLRDDLGADATATITSSDAGPLERFANALGVAVGTLVGSTVAELVASPEGILQLLGGVPARPLFGAAIFVRNTVPETFDRASMRYESPTAFVLHVPNEDGDAATDFVLRPRGLTWQIAEVRLPTGG